MNDTIEWTDEVRKSIDNQDQIPHALFWMEASAINVVMRKLAEGFYILSGPVVSVFTDKIDGKLFVIRRATYKLTPKK